MKYFFSFLFIAALFSCSNNPKETPISTQQDSVEATKMSFKSVLAAGSTTAVTKFILQNLKDVNKPDTAWQTITTNADGSIASVDNTIHAYKNPTAPPPPNKL